MKIVFYQWDSRGVYVAHMTQEDTQAVPPSSTTTAPPELSLGKVAIWIGGGQWVIGDQPIEPVYVEPVPPMVSMRQARLSLLGAGMLAAIEVAIDSIEEDTQRAAARIEWDYATMVERGSAFVALLGAAIGLTAENTDDLFRAAIKL